MRRRLTLLTAATMLLVLMTFIVPLGLLLRDVAVDRAVQAATSRAQSLSIISATADRETLDLSVQEVNAGGQQMSVFLSDGTVLGAPAPRTDAVDLAAGGRSFAVDGPSGREIFFFAQDQAGAAAVLRAFVSDSEMRAGVTRSWLVLAGLGVALLAIGVVVADRLAGSLVRPLTSVADVAHRLAAGELGARASPSGPPEVREVATGLNQLAERIRVLLREEREAVADLSHRLRTPLTALRLDVESLGDPAEATRLGGNVDALERAVTQVIVQARSANTEGTRTTTCDAAVVVRGRVTFWAVLAEDTGREMQVELHPGPLLVAVARADLEACVDAVFGNVFAHTEDGVAFAVRLQRLPDGTARIQVSDHGAGIASSVERRATGRGVTGGDSTGLGLDIARRTAESSGGRLVVGPAEGGGTSVVVELGAAGEARANLGYD